MSKVWLTGFLLIALPFPRRGAPGRDDADDLDSVALGVILGDRVGDQKHSDAMHHAKGLPAFFAVLDPVLPGEAEGIAEHLHGHLKGDPVMLSLVGAVLGLVPGEAHCHGINVVAILPRLKSLSDPPAAPSTSQPLAVPAPARFPCHKTCSLLISYFRLIHGVCRLALLKKPVQALRTAVSRLPSTRAQARKRSHPLGHKRLRV